MNFDFLLDIKSFRHLDHRINNIHARSKGVIRAMILKVCNSLPVLTMKMKVMQTGKSRGDAPLNLTVMIKEMIICEALYIS